MLHLAVEKGRPPRCCNHDDFGAARACYTGWGGGAHSNVGVRGLQYMTCTIAINHEPRALTEYSTQSVGSHTATPGFADSSVFVIGSTSHSCKTALLLLCVDVSGVM